VLEPHVTSALANLFPSGTLQRLDQLGPGHGRGMRAHAGTARRRRTTPAGIGRPSSRRPST
jgi:hypothetical protein